MAMETFVVKAKIVYADLISICFSCNAGAFTCRLMFHWAL